MDEEPKNEEEEVEPEQNDETTEEDSEDKPETDETDWKKQAGILKRELTKLQRKLEPKDESPKGKPGEFDYGQKAFLVASGISGKDEMKLVQEAVNNTGKSIEDILETKWFQAELEEIRDRKKTDEAMPKGSKRSSGPSRDSADYWIAKGEMPPATPENRKLRQEIVNKKLAVASQSEKFTDHPIG